MLLGWSWGPEGRNERAGEEASFNRLLLESKACQGKAAGLGWHSQEQETHRTQEGANPFFLLSSHLPLVLICKAS